MGMIGNIGEMVGFGRLKSASANSESTLIWLLWLFLLLVGGNCQRTHPTEVNALRSIQNDLEDPYNSLRNWRRGDPCTSKWVGINCSNSTTDAYLHITELLLLGKNLSGTLSPELGRLSYLKILDFMWNNITGTIPPEIGNISTLELLLLNGNKLTGSLPDELGNLSNLNRIQIDENRISGPIPSSFANMRLAKHFHMNNNSLSGSIPTELSRLPNLLHLLLDNNNLSGDLPPELSNTPKLLILQLDNNNFTSIPTSYGNMSKLVKLSLRNCSLLGTIPDWSNMSDIAYIDLSMNQLTGSIPNGSLSQNITTIDLSSNNLNGTVPSNFATLSRLQKLSLANNSLSGSVASAIWLSRSLTPFEGLIVDFGNNNFSDVTGNPVVPPNVTIAFRGNPLCSRENLVQLCGPGATRFNDTSVAESNTCPPYACPPPYEYSPRVSFAIRCFCSAPLYVGYRLKSPGFSDFRPYFQDFKNNLSSELGVNLYQLDVDSAEWSRNRLRMYLKIFPKYIDNNTRRFNDNEVIRIRGLFSGWKIRNDDVFGPFELLNFTLSEIYSDVNFSSLSSGISKGALVGIILGTIAASVTASALAFLFICRRRTYQRSEISSKRRLSTRTSIKIDGVKEFTFSELLLATNDFDSSTQVGRGGYGKVYRGVLADGTVVAIKRAQEGSLQGEKEFLTEIQLLSRLHHRNLVSLLGYCDEQGEQMLIYEFVANGALRDHLSGKTKVPLAFSMRVRTALGAARGILYLHTEANPPIFHRDIKANNILLDSKYNAKVADFGLSRLAPVPELEGAVPSHVSTVVKGTPGYLDPEYFLTHKLTDKSDVYSLGVVFLELLTGMHPIYHGKNIVREVNSAYQSGIIFSIIDDSMGSYPSECVHKFVNLALSCCEDLTEKRPSMAKVVRELENIQLMMPESDLISAEALMDKSGKEITPPSSSSNVRTSYVSDDISGGNLVSGVLPTIAPR